jgi:hypothetical protein
VEERQERVMGGECTLYKFENVLMKPITFYKTYTLIKIFLRHEGEEYVQIVLCSKSLCLLRTCSL